MSVTGTVLIDLTAAVPRDRQRHRASALGQAPDRMHAVVLVGALAVEPEAVRAIREHIDRLEVEVAGDPDAVRRWLDALRFDPTLPAVGSTS